jgi:hypothetical protein
MICRHGNLRYRNICFSHVPSHILDAGRVACHTLVCSKALDWTSWWLKDYMQTGFIYQFQRVFLTMSSPQPLYDNDKTSGVVPCP